MADEYPIPESRRQVTGPFGKCTEEVKSRIPFEIKEGFARIAHEIGMTESELLREMIMVKVCGLEMVRRIHQERLDRVAGIGNK